MRRRQSLSMGIGPSNKVDNLAKADPDIPKIDETGELVEHDNADEDNTTISTRTAPHLQSTEENTLPIEDYADKDDFNDDDDGFQIMDDVDPNAEKIGGVVGRRRAAATSNQLQVRRASAWQRQGLRKGANFDVEFAGFKSDTASGTFELEIKGGRNISKSSLLGFPPDVFFELYFNGLLINQSSIERENPYPVWNWKSTIELPLDRPFEDCLLTIDVYDADGGHGEDWRAEESDDESDVTGKQERKEKKHIADAKAGSFKTSLLSALFASVGVPYGERSKKRKHLGRLSIDGSDLHILGSLRQNGESRWYKIVDENFKLKGELEMTGYYEEQVTKHTLLNNADKNLVDNKESQESDSEDTSDDDDDDDDGEDTLQIQVLAAKNLSKVDMLGLSDPYCVLYYNKKEIGRTNVVENNLYPRWNNEIFQIYVPAGMGCTNEDGSDGELLVEVFDKSNIGADTFLGNALVGGLTLQNILGFVTKKTKNKKNVNDDDTIATIATVTTGDGSQVTIERGHANWVNLSKSDTRTTKENKFVKGALQLAGTYISGKLTPGEGALAEDAPHHRVKLHILSAQDLSQTPVSITKKASMSLFSSKKETGKKINCSTMCVVRWNGSEIGRTAVIHETQAPKYDDCFLIRVPPVWTIYQCELEIAVHGEPTLTGELGPFLGQANILGEDLVDLLSNKFISGTYKEYIHVLNKSQHFPVDDQKLVGGLIKLRGLVEMEQEGEYDRFKDCRGATIDLAQLNANKLENIDVDISHVKNIRRLEIGVLECTELMQMDKFGTANAFVSLKWNGRDKGSTPVCPNELNPVWEDTSFSLPIPADVRLVDCVLELKVENKSRMGTIAFLGHHIISGDNLERLSRSNGEPIWYDLQRNRYYDDAQNVKCQGALRIYCSVYDDDGVASVPPRTVDTYQPSRIRLSVQGVKSLAPRMGIPKMTLVTSRCQPYVQFIWNGNETGCTSNLYIPYSDINYHTEYHWLNEEFSFIIPSEKLLQDCVLEMWMWDRGTKEESGADCFCGMRSLTGQELLNFIYKTPDRFQFERKLREAQEAGDSIMDVTDQTPNIFALNKTWNIHEEYQKNAKCVLSIIGNFVPDEEPPSLEVEELSDEDFSENENQQSSLQIDTISEETRSMAGSLPAMANISYHEEENPIEQLTDTEKHEIIQSELDEYWQEQKYKHEIIIPDGAESHFTKHYDESLGKFYYYDHVSGLTTWDKPLGNISLYLSPEQIDSIRLAHERRHNRAIGNSPEKDSKDIRHLVLKKMRKEKEQEIKQHKARVKAEVEQKNKNVWQRVLMDADMAGGNLSLSWQHMGCIAPVVFDFSKNFGRPLMSLRLIGIGLKELPLEFGSYLTNLHFLSLANNELTYLPESFVQMTSLREINLLKNRLTCLPEKIGLLCSLQKLDIANNYLTRLPITFAALNMMDRIDLECNKLAVLPENLDNLVSCTTLICNNNELMRLPRSIGRMPSLTSLSATHNKIIHIPDEIIECQSLKVLRLSLNQITKIPEKLGGLRKLKELSIDYNALFKLPMSFYMLNKLKILRLEGNESLTDPPPDVIGAGAQAVVQYFKKKFEDDVTWRQRVIISSVQAVLGQAHDRGLTDSSQFEPNTKVEGSDDGWYAIQLSYFWGELLPEMKNIWRDEGLRNIHNPNWVNSFPFNERDVLWAFSNFSDAYGMMLKRQKANFRRCACVDAIGRRKPCVPPAYGFMCNRIATLLKMHFVMSGQRKERLWIAYKKSGIDEAVKTAEATALKYLHSSVGKLWLETEAYKQAEITLNAMGGEAQQVWREKAVERKQAYIIAHYDRKKDHVEKVRDEKAAVYQEELDTVKDEWKKAKEGYMKTTLEEQMQELMKTLANMDENVHLERLTLECERKCKDVIDVVYDAESSDSSDSDISLPDSEDESELAQLRRERYVRRHEEELENEKIARRKNKLGPMPKSHLEHAVLKAKETIYPITSIIMPHNRAREKGRAQAYKKMKANISHILDVVDIRIRKFFQKVGGNFDEIQKEAKHELYRQYLENSVEQARDRAKTEFDVIDQVRQSMGGVGVEKIFKAWKRWALNKLQRLRRDARAEFRTSTLAFNAAMESVGIAQARVDMWKRCKDIYTEKSFWTNTLTGEITDERPGLQHFMPPSFEMPPPPKPLPEGVSIDTSSDESEDAYRKVRAKSKKIVVKKDDAKNTQKDSKEIRSNRTERNSDISSDSYSSSSSSSDDDDSFNDARSEGKYRDDISALSDTSGLIDTNASKRLPVNNIRRNSDAAHELQSPRTFTSVHKNDSVGAEDASIRSQFFVDSFSKNGGSVKSLTSVASHQSGFSYGPDSLRPNKGSYYAKKPLFEEEEERLPPPSNLDLRVQAARDYIKSLEGTSQEQKVVDYSIVPSDILHVSDNIRQRAEDETNKADRIIRLKRSGLNVVRHQTYINQAHRVQRSMEENVARRLAREAENEIYVKPELDDLLDLAGGDLRMTNLPGAQGTHLRTILAHRALQVEKKLHDKAVRKKLTEPKPWSVVGHYIAPIWRENALNSDDDDSSDEDERREKERRKEMRKAERRAFAQKILDEKNGNEDEFSVSVPSVDTKVPLEERMGKPRSQQVKTSPNPKL